MVQLFRLIGFKLSFYVGLAILFSASVSIAADCSADPNECTPKKLCEIATELDWEGFGPQRWSSEAGSAKHIALAQGFGMSCGVITVVDPCDSDPNKCTTIQLCEKATTNKNNKTFWNEAAVAYVKVAKTYELPCGVESALSIDEGLIALGKAITLFGVNLDMSTDEVKETLAKRFSCGWSNIYNSKSKKCITDGGRLLTMSFNNLGEIDELSFNCDTYKGCTFSVDEIFKTLSNSITFQSEPIKSISLMCSNGELGDQVCVTPTAVDLIRNKFRVGVVSFD